MDFRPLVLVLATTSSVASPQESVTFSEHVAPIVFHSCLPCHREGESGPFPLQTYAEVAKRARQLAEVTKSRYMPPWLPAPEHGDFEGNRRLSEADIATFERWAAAGAPEGDPARLPPLPKLAEGWSLGEPDLVLTLAEPFVVPAEGRDVFQNFVLPIPLERARFVEALELRPGNKRVAHHATIKVDRTASSRTLDAESKEPGYPGMEMALSESPGGQILGWTPGAIAHRAPSGMGWTMEPGTDLIVQLHLVPNGKEEPIQPSVAIYFTDTPPAKKLMVLRMRKEEIDIPPGERAYLAENSITLPVAARLSIVYPHAHYLGKRIEVSATFPDGTQQILILIEDWDFFWQSEYRYRTPLALPPGTRITMRYLFDNSADNPRNPNSPPLRVRSGNSSADEMATLTMQLETEGAEARKALTEAVCRQRVEEYPNLWPARLNLGAILAEQGKLEEAATHLAAGLALAPENVELHMNLGAVQASLGRLPEALASLREALRLGPGNANVLVNLAQVESMGGNFAAAAEHYRAVLAASPRDGRALRGLGTTLVRLERLDEAAAAFEQALALDPRDFQAHFQLGKLAFRANRLEDATRHFQAGLALQPLAEAHQDLARVFSARGMPAEAARELEAAKKLGGGKRR